ADRAKLFKLPPYGAPGWTANMGPYTYIKAAYQQLTDNLLDPAHVSFVHLSSLGSAAMEDIPVETRQDGDTVVTSRWTLDQPPVGIFGAFRYLSGNADRWQIYQFYPPSISVTDFGIGAVGMGHGDAARDRGMRIHSCHFIAPETERTSHYFWMQIRNFAESDDGVSQKMTEQLIMAFAEDKAVLEAVQAGADEAGGRPPVGVAVGKRPRRNRGVGR